MATRIVRSPSKVMGGVTLSYLRVSGETTLEHLRDFDTHEPLSLPPGNYEVRRQREYTPEGWRQVAD